MPREQHKHSGVSHSRVEALDLLRLAAVLPVILFHYGFRGAAADGYTAVSLPDLQWLLKYGYLGVEMFFVISGFVIAYSADGRSAVSFAIARIARIYPSFLICMTLTFLLTLAFGAPQLTTNLGQWFANLFIVAPAFKSSFMDGAYWSIVYEITFYAWVFLLLLTGWFRRKIEIIVLLWLSLSLFNELVLGSGALRRIFLTDESGFFAAGLLLYEMFKGRRDAVVHFLFAFAVACAVVEATIGLEWMRHHFGIAFDDLIVAGLCLGAIAAVAVGARIRRLPLHSGFILAVGGLTYPLYLLHQHIGYIALNRLERFASPALLVAALTFALLVGSWLLWHYLERPAQRLAKGSLTALAHHLGVVAELPAVKATDSTVIQSPSILGNAATNAGAEMERSRVGRCLTLGEPNSRAMPARPVALAELSTGKHHQLASGGAGRPEAPPRTII
jgi:peptidoglycan/LPS O-acetylase OafA/YrhL